MTGTGRPTTERPSAVGPTLDARIAALTGETLVELLDRAVSRTPDAVALVIRRGMADERWTYGLLRERSLRIATALRTRGVSEGDRVLTWSANDPWLVAAMFATWRLGAIVVPLDLRMQTEVAVRIGTRTRPTLLLAGPDVEPTAVDALGVPVVRLDAFAIEHERGPTSALLDGSAHGRVDPDAVAEILFTSGTTSDPKGVVLTHGQILHTARAIAQTGMGREPDRALGIIPLSHMYGQAVPLLMSLITGSTLVFLHALTPKAIRATMERERVTAVTLVPQLIAIIMEGIESEARRGGREASLTRARRVAGRLPEPARRLLFRRVLTALGGSLRVISSGGARLPEELQAAWELMGVRVVQGYGTTECAAICGHSRRRQRRGTVGPPLAGIEVRIAPDGELLARGPNVMHGYWEDPAATAEVLDADGWLHTGDAATIDEAGEVSILGRTRDRVSLPNGLNVYPEDLEGALRATGAVRAAVAFEAAPGRLAAALVPAEAEIDDATLDDAVRRANAALAPHQRMGAWRRWPGDDFPRTHTLKIRRGPVQAWFAGDEPAAVEPPPAPDDGPAAVEPPPAPDGGRRAARAPTAANGVPIERVIATIAAVVGEARGGEPPDITASTPLASLELDSLLAVTLALRLEEAFDAPLSDDEIVGAPDVGALRAIVADRQGRPPPPPPSRWAFSPAARAARRVLDATLIGWALRLVARPRVEGLGHLEGVAGPVLICPDHASHLDGPLVRAALPPRIRDRSAIAAAADVWFDGNLLGAPVALTMGAIPFGRTADIRASMERVADLVNDGHSVIIFPEGKRSADGRLGEMRSGIGLLATSLRVPVVPAHLAGARDILPKGAWLPRRRAGRGVVVRFGAPLTFDETTDVHAATEAIGRAIADLASGAPDGTHG